MIPEAGTPSLVEADVGMEEMGFQVHERESSKRCLLQQEGELDKQYLEQCAGRRIAQRARFGRRTVASMEQVVCIGRIYEVLDGKLIICACSTRTVLLARSTS